MQHDPNSFVITGENQLNHNLFGLSLGELESPHRRVPHARHPPKLILRRDQQDIGRVYIKAKTKFLAELQR